MFAEASVVPGTVSDLECLGIHVEVLTILVAALSESLKEVADGHLGHLVFVEKLTLVPLLTEVSHPVFAYDCPLPTHVTERTVATS